MQDNLDHKAATQRETEPEYAGFWIRVAATLIDNILLNLLLFPIVYSIYGDQYFNPDQLFAGGWDVLLSLVTPAIAIITFWIYRSATPGKMILKLKILDADTGAQPDKRQFVIRYLSYFISGIPLGAGFLWLAFDKRKQGWHDKIAKTVVVCERKTSTLAA